MPSIKISNMLNVELLTAETGPGSGFSKYFKGNPAGFIASTELAAALNKPITTLSPSDIGLGLTFQKDGEFGKSGIEWTLIAGANITVNAAQPGSTMAGEAVYSNPIQIQSNRTYVGVTFSPRLSLELSQAFGSLKFGFSPSHTLEYRAGRCYDITTQTPTLGESLKDLLCNAVIPADLEDLRNMRTGDVASVSGQGQFKFSASFNVAQALNPLATPTLGLQEIGELKVEAGASLTVGANVDVSGRYQFRLHKLDATRVRLGLYKMAGTQFGFDVKASAGISASLGERDMTEKLLGFLGATKADVTEMVDAGLSDAQIKEIKDAVEASISRSIALSVTGSFATNSDRTTVFEYDMELNRLDATGSQLLERALQADLSGLTSLEAQELPAGIRLLSSVVETVRKRSVTWRINLLGVINVLHVTSLVKDGKIFFDADTGELTITDSATAKDIMVAANALNRDKLRRLMMQSAVLTAAYHATGLESSMRFTGSISYYERIANAHPQNVSDFLDNLVALALMSAPQKNNFLSTFLAGKASVYVEAEFAQASFQSMFADQNGKPWGQDHYDQIGRSCVAQLILPGDPNSFRREPMLDDQLWKKMTEYGQANLYRLLNPRYNSGIPLALIIHDYSVIRWWSRAMSKAAEKVARMRQFLAANQESPEKLKQNPEFLARRKDLHDSLADAVKQSEPEFLDCWGVIVMYTAANGLADVRGMVLTDGPVISESRRAGVAAIA